MHSERLSPSTDWSFTVRDGVLIFANTPDLYRDEIWRQPILQPK